MVEYHDNAVKLNQRGFKITGGRYIVDDFRISEGQDPDGVNKKGDVHEIDMSKGTPTLTFRCGRHKTKEVGVWWTNTMTVSSYAYSKPDPALNFAFIGTLILEIKGNADIQTATFTQFGLGQGSLSTSATSTMSDWWLGGIACTMEDEKIGEVRFFGNNEKGAQIYALIERCQFTGDYVGNSGPNDIFLNKISLD